MTILNQISLNTKLFSLKISNFMENKHFWKSNIVLYAVSYTSKSTSMITFIYYNMSKT